MESSTKSESKERRRAQYLIRRIRKFLFEGNWAVRFSVVGEDEAICRRYEIAPTSIGFCDYETQTLHVHYKKDILVIVIHEALHALYPDNDEEETLRLEQLVLDHLGPRQARNIMIALLLRLE